MAFARGPKIVKDGLVLLLDAASERSYPGTGNIWYDLSGNKNDTNILSASFNSNGGYFESINENPSNLIFTTPSSVSLFNALSITCGGWTIEETILIDDTTYPESAAGTKFGSGSIYQDDIGFDWGHETSTFNYLNMTVNDGENKIRLNIILNNLQSQYDVWINRCFLYDRTNGEIKIYYNGIYQNNMDISSVTGSIYDNSGIVWGTLYGWCHDGYRSNMKIYNKILSEDEIKQNFNAQRRRFGL